MCHTLFFVLAFEKKLGSGVEAALLVEKFCVIFLHLAGDIIGFFNRYFRKAEVELKEERLQLRSEFTSQSQCSR